MGDAFDALLRRLVAPPGAVDTSAIGARIGPYIVEGVLGSGGMGVVYRARDVLLDRAVALKLLPAETAGDPERRTHLLREARIAASIVHPHVATVYGAGIDHDRVWIAMELVDGATLRAQLRTHGKLVPSEVVRIGYAVASALAAAHAAGVVHRDLKPENVMLAKDGAPKVLDFGVARIVDGDADLALRSTQLVGTPSYMAPEQQTTNVVDDRADVYALGVMLHELAAGTRPPPIASSAAALDRVIAQCLATAPADRPSAVDVAEALRRSSDAGARSESLQVVAANNLPVRLSSFIGRERDIVAVREALRDARVVTLVGIGGVGKTRLAIEVARAELQGSYARLAVVELGALDHPRLVAPEVARVLGVDEGARLAERIGDERVLVVLDNCEHVIDAAAAVASTLLQAPNVRLLVASREPLRVEGERVHQVPPLTGADAVRLLVDRIRERVPELALADRDARALAEIAARVDGIPLALELAAARANALTIVEIAARLDDRFRLLTTGQRDVPARHRTLRALLDWSYELLDPETRRVFEHCSVFAGSFGAAAADAVCGRDVLDEISQLVDKSLLVAELGRGEARYHILETVRAYALEHLRARGAEETARDRHFAYYAALLEHAQLRGAGAHDTLARLDPDTDNIRAMVERADRTQLSRRAAHNVGMFAIMRGRTSEGREQMTRLLARCGRTLERAELSIVLATLIYNAGDYATSRPIMEDALAIARELGDDELVQRAAHNLADLLVKAGEPHAALAMLAETGVRSFNGTAARFYVGTLEDEEIDAWTAHRADDLEYLAEINYYRGALALARGDHARAAERFRDSFIAAYAVRYPTAMLFALWGTAGLARARGDAVRAAQLHGAYDGRNAWHGLAPLPVFAPERAAATAALRAALGDKFDVLVREGATWTWERIAEEIERTLSGR